MKAQITIELDNAAFDPDPAPELVARLQDLAFDIEGAYINVKTGHRYAIEDSNGNTVGEIVFIAS